MTTSFERAVEATGEPVASRFGAWRWWVFALLLLSTLVPLVLWPGFFFPYVVPRNIFFRVTIELASAAVALLVVAGRARLSLRHDYLFVALASFVVASAISAGFSPAPTHSFFGDFERMGGVWAWFHLLLFYLLLRTLDDRQFGLILNAAAVVAALVVAYGLAQYQRSWAHSLGVEAPVAAITGTLGNSGLLAGYLLVAVALAAYLAARSPRFRVFHLAGGGLGLVALILTQNRSAVLGIAAALFVGAAIFLNLPDIKREKPVARLIFFAAALVFVIVAGLARLYPGGALASALPAVFTKGGATWVDAARTIQWEAALDGFRDRPLVGYGPENHNLVWGAHFDPRIYTRNEDIFDRTHNQFLEVLATGGLIGFLTFAAIFAAVAHALHSAWRKGRLSGTETAALAAAQVGYGVYLFFWFFDLSAAMLWILLLVIVGRSTYGGIIVVTLPAPQPRRTAPWLAAGIVLLVGGALFVHAIEPLRATRALATIQGGRASGREMSRSFETAYGTMAPQTSLVPIVFAGYVGSFAPEYSQIRADPARRAGMDYAFERTFGAFRREIRRDPLNGRLHTYEARVLLLGSAFYESRAHQLAAVRSLETAIALSPRRIQPRMLRASAAMLVKDYEVARAELDVAIRLEPPVSGAGYLSREPGYQRGEPSYQLAKLFIATNKHDSAVSALYAAMSKDFAGTAVPYIAASQFLERSGRRAEAARLLSTYMETKYGKAIWNPHPKRQLGAEPRDVAIAGHLPLLHLRAGQTAEALSTAPALTRLDTSSRGAVGDFSRDLRSGLSGKWSGRSTLLRCDPSSRADGQAPVDQAKCNVFAVPAPAGPD